MPSSRERGEPAGRAPAGASFASARVRPARRRPPIVLLGFLVAVGALVAIGLGGRAATPAASGPPIALAASAAASLSPAPSRAASAAPSDEVVVPPSRQPVSGPQMTSEPGPLALTARRQPDSVFLHGDVFVDQVTWVYLSLQDASGRVAGWASVSVPGAAGPATGDGPDMRFDLELAAAYASFPGPLALQANAYDATGRIVASGRIEGLSPSFVVPMNDGRTGFRPARVPDVAASHRPTRFDE